jgi:aminoglycoside phosphotransferase (APT) family kinase protein/8-oxo-dGTP pyrophosphatase MutT (NUDIX family)
MLDNKIFGGFTEMEPITKGQSNDMKYRVVTTDGQIMLLRVTDIAEYDRKKAEYGMMERVYALGVPTPQPFEFGICESGKSVYSLSGWLDGEDVESQISSMTETEQYCYGMKAGEVLRKIHSLPAPDNAERWKERFRRKIQTRIDLHNKHNLRSKNSERVIEYLLNNQSWLDDRAQTFWHGDFNIGNHIILPDGNVATIDYNYWNLDHGDPWWEFVIIAWGEEPPAHYFTGMIHGYFNNDPPSEFFKALSYYYACDALSALCYAYLGTEPYKPDDGVSHMENVLRWFDNMQNPVPTWYLKDCELWDIYDADRNPTRTTILRSDAKNLKDGEFHLAAFIYIMRSDGKFLITKRSPQKKTFPNMWEIPHGAVLSGEISLDAAVREAFEECGLILKRESAEFITEYRGGNLIADKWLFRQDFNLSDIVLQEGETCDARACTPDDILELIENRKMQEYIYDDVIFIKEKWGKKE